MESIYFILARMIPSEVPLHSPSLASEKKLFENLSLCCTIFCMSLPFIRFSFRRSHAEVSYPQARGQK